MKISRVRGFLIALSGLVVLHVYAQRSRNLPGIIESIMDAERRALERDGVSPESGIVGWLVTAVTPAGYVLSSIAQLASLQGAVLGLVMGVAVVGMELSSGGWSTILLVEPRRARILGAKVVAAVGALVAASAVLMMSSAIVGAVLRAGVTADVPGVPWARVGIPGWVLVLAPLLVFALFSLVGLLSAIIARSILGGLALGAGVLLADSVAGRIDVLRPWTLGFNVWSLGRDFTRYPMQLLHGWPGYPSFAQAYNLWVARSEGAFLPRSPVAAAVYLVFLVALLAPATLWVFRRQEQPG